MHLCFSCISYLYFGIEIAGETKSQQHARSICWLHPFSRARTYKGYRSYDADKIYWRRCQVYRK